LLTAAERIQYEGYLRREDTNTAILKRAEMGVSIKEIVRLTGHSRGLVRRVLRGLRSDVFRVAGELARTSPVMARRAVGCWSL
jgi:hypothetical protein